MSFILKSINVFIFCILNTVLIGQCMQVQVPFEYVPNRSDLIVECSYLEQSTFWNQDRNVIYTAYKMEIHKVVKGDIDKDDIWILTKGGTIGDVKMVVEPEVTFGENFIGVVLLNKSGLIENEDLTEKYYSAWAMDQSVYKYDFFTETVNDGFRSFDLKGGELINRLSRIANQQPIIKSPLDIDEFLANKQNEVSQNRVITSLSPDTLRAGTDDVLTITGNGFGSVQGNVEFRDADITNPTSYFSCPSMNIDSWTDTQIKVRVPRRAGSGLVKVRPVSGADQYSNSQITVLYNISSFADAPTNTYVRYVAETTAGNIEYQLSNTFASNTAAAASFNRAMDTWKCKSDINWIQGSNTTIDASVNDDTSVIRWSNGEISYPTIGQYNGFFFACSGNPSEWYADEFDIMFLPNGSGVTWEYGPGNPSGGESDFESTAIHEIGHALLLGHVSDPAAVMYPSGQAGTTNRDPDLWAVNGALFSMPKHQAGGINCSGYFPFLAIPPLVVQNLNDQGAGSLRQTILDVCPEKEINFNASLSGTLTLSSSPIVLDKSLTINGLGINTITLSGNNTNRIFDIQNGVVVDVNDLKMTNGFSNTNGGAFYNQGEIRLSNVLLENNFQGSLIKGFTNGVGATTVIKNEVFIEE